MDLTFWLPAMVLLGLAASGSFSPAYRCATKSEERDAMETLTWLTAIATVLLLAYLFAALLRPEWF